MGYYFTYTRPPLSLRLLFVGESTDCAMVVILEKQRDIIGNLYTARIVNLLNISV
jgi:hypothetical protein